MLQASFALITFNQESYVERALTDALGQDYAQLEIIVSDDGSTDSTYEKLSALVRQYSGPHRLTLLPRSANVGLIGNINRVLAACSGELVIIGAGDDGFRHDRVSTLVKAYLAQQRPMLLHSRARTMDAAGNLLPNEEPPPRLRSSIPLNKAWQDLSLYLGATAAWSRELLDRFPPIEERDAFEDLVMGFRAALFDRTLYVDEALVDYRVGNGLSHQHPTTFDAFTRRRQRMLRVNVAVFRQRLQDLLHSGISDRNLHEQLERRLQGELGRLRFYGELVTGKQGWSLRTAAGWLDEARKYAKNWLKFAFRRNP